MTGADVIAILAAIRKQAELLQIAVPLRNVDDMMAVRFANTCREAADLVAEYASNLAAIEGEQ